MIRGLIGTSNASELGAGRRKRLAPALEDLRQGRFADAAAAFEREARSAAPGSAIAVLAAESRLGVGLSHVHAGNFGVARRELERALELDLGQAAAARVLARVLLRSGEPAVALAWLDHAAIDGEESHGMLLLRAACLESAGDREAAGHALDRALAAALRAPLPAFRRAWLPPPSVGEDDGDTQNSAASRHADRRCRWALRLFETRPAEAAQHLETALALNPRYLRARLALGLVRLQQRRAREAVEELEAARELEPTYPDVRAWLGLARLAAGDPRGALRTLERAVALQREFARAHRHLALVYHALGLGSSARRATLRGWIRDTEVTPLAGRPALAGLSADAADEPELRRALAIRPGSPDLHLALGRRLLGRGDHGEARTAFRAALTMRPDYTTASLELARSEIALARLPEAERQLTRVVDARPAWVDAQALLGRTRLLLGNPAGAVAPLRAAVRQRPELEPARSDLGWAVLGQGTRTPPGKDRGRAA